MDGEETEVEGKKGLEGCVGWDTLLCKQIAATAHTHTHMYIMTN